MVTEHLFYRKVFKLDSNGHWIILLLIDAMEVIISERDRGHSTSMMRTGYVVDGLNVARCFFLAEEVSPPPAKLPDIVLLVSRRGGSTWLTLVQASG